MAVDTSMLDSLANIVSPEQVVTNPVQLLTYEGDASLDQGTPDAVVFPRNVYQGRF